MVRVEALLGYETAADGASFGEIASWSDSATLTEKAPGPANTTVLSEHGTVFAHKA